MIGMVALVMPCIRGWKNGWSSIDKCSRAISERGLKLKENCHWEMMMNQCRQDKEKKKEFHGMQTKERHWHFLRFQILTTCKSSKDETKTFALRHNASHYEVEKGNMHRLTGIAWIGDWEIANIFSNLVSVVGWLEVQMYGVLKKTVTI